MNFICDLQNEPGHSKYLVTCRIKKKQLVMKSQVLWKIQQKLTENV